MNELTEMQLWRTELNTIVMKPSANGYAFKVYDFFLGNKNRSMPKKGCAETNTNLFNSALNNSQV